MKLKLVVLILVSSLFFVACAGINNVTSSKPSIEGNTSIKLGKDWLFHLDDIAFNIKPWNQINSDTLLFPVPYNTTYQRGFTKNFSATILIKSNLNNTHINISKIEYIDASNKKHNPKYMRGPFNCKKEAVNNPKHVKRVAVSANVKLLDNTENCIFIEFDVKAPSPKTLFKFKLKEITSKTKTVKIPAISFSNENNNTLAVLP